MVKDSNIEHAHHHHHAASRGVLVQIIASFILCRVLSLVHIGDSKLELLLYIIIYIFIGYDVLFAAFKGILHGRLFDENFLIAIATLGVFAIGAYDSSWGYGEAIDVMLFFKIGEYLQGYASRKSMQKIKSLGHEIKGLGESASEAFITKFAKVYTPFICFGAIAIAVIPPLFNIGILGNDANWSEWIYRALVLLVISCPCALVISIPLTFFASIIGASRKGILITDGCCLEILNKGSFPENEIIMIDDNPERMEWAKKIAHRCMNIVWQNIALAIGVKLLVLVLSIFGIFNMWLAIFADTGIMIIAVLNAMRAMYPVRHN